MVKHNGEAWPEVAGLHELYCFCVLLMVSFHYDIHFIIFFYVIL